MAEPSKTPTTPAYSITALARIRIYDGMQGSEINHLLASQAHTIETLAMVIDAQGGALRRVMAVPPKGSLWSAIQARRAASQAVRPISQAAERLRGGAASSRAAWRVVQRIYAVVTQPPKGSRKGVNWGG